MLYARECVFNASSKRFAHLRLDSSPQFAKNYLLAELDKISFVNGCPDIDDMLLTMVISNFIFFVFDV